MRLMAFVRVLFVAAVLAAGAVSAIATISSALSTITVAGNGAQTSFSFPFIGVAASDITVVLTNSAGAQTTLAQGPGTTQYQVTLNAIVPPNLWGVGGSIAYNPSGTPVPSGSTLTITRVLPFLQTVSLQNQASFGQLAQATEQGLDLLDMQIQQLATTIGNVIKAPLSDPAGLVYTLPSATARANQFLCFDGSGNVIACASVPAGTISSAMQPVVNAASLAAGRTALGLGTAATGTINYGLQSGVSGTGLIDVNQAPVQDSTGQTVTAAFHQTVRICTGPITYTLPRGNTTWAGFGFWVYSVSGICTITPNAADNFLGVASGTGIAVNPGSWVYITTSAAGSAVWWADYHGPIAPNLVASSNGTALTLTLYSGPLQFRDTNLANGEPVWSLPANGIAITIPSTATIGTANSTPFRLWVFVTYNAGTPLLAVAKCSTATAVFPCGAWENLDITSTTISTGATSANALYASAGVSSDSVIIVGYIEYGSGLATAGTWASTPTKIALCLAPRSCRKPGDIVQTVVPAPITTTTSCQTTQTQTTITAAITPTSTANLVRARAGVGGTIGSTHNMALRFSRGAGPSLFGANPVLSIASGTFNPFTLFEAIDSGLAAGTLTYYVYCTSDTNSAATAGSANGSSLILEEIMGALDIDKILPANDDQPLRKVG